MKTKYLYLQKKTDKSVYFCRFLGTDLNLSVSSTHSISLLATPPPPPPPPGVAKGFIKGKALRLLRTNSSKTLFEESINNFKSRKRDRGYPNNIVEKTLAVVKFTERKYICATGKTKGAINHIAFRRTIQPLVQNLKKVLMSKWHIIEKQPLLRKIFREPPIISYKRGRSLEDILIRAKLLRLNKL